MLYAYTRRRIYLPEDSLSDAQLNTLLANRVLHFALDTERVYDLIGQRLYNIKKDLGVIFGLSDENAKLLFPKFRIKIEQRSEDYQVQLIKKNFDFHFYLTRNVEVKVNKKAGEKELQLKIIARLIDEIDRSTIKSDLISALYHYIVVSPIFDSHFFPVERTSMYTYHKDIQGTRNKLVDMLHAQGGVNQQQTINFVLKNSSQFPLVIGQTLDAANAMGTNKKNKGFYAALADEIERDIMRGKVIVTEDGDLHFVSEDAIDKVVPIQLSASMDKAISGIVFYLRHISSEGDMIFIDEPEVNCHPNIQVQLTRIFAQMINAGLRVVISTHSDYIIRELNNLIMLNGASEAIDEDLRHWGYISDMKLNYEDVGAYLFDYGFNGLVDMKPLKVTDTGFEVSTIDATIRQQNEISQALYYELRYGKKD